MTGSSLPPISSGLLPSKGLIAVLLVVLSGMGLGWQQLERHQQEQDYQAVLAEVNQLKAAQDYKACEARARQIPSSFSLYSQVQSRLQECSAIQAAFDRAQSFARMGDLNLAIAEVREIADPSATSRVNQLMADWSEQILQLAQRAYEDRNGRIQDALQLAARITPDNPLYGEAQTRIQTWTQQWAYNETYWKTAQAALYAQQFPTALAQIQQITHPYWQQQALPIATAVFAIQAATPPVQPNSSLSPSSDHSTKDLANASYENGGAQPDPEHPGTAPNSLENGDWANYGSYEAMGGPGALLTLKFLVPLSLPLMLALGRPRR